MARPNIRRFYRQVSTLVQKNILIAVKHPISTLVSTLVIPIALTLIFCYLKNIQPSSVGTAPNGFSKDSFPIYDLADAITATSSRRLAFVTNGISDQDLDGIIQGLKSENTDTVVLNDTSELFDACPQTIQGTSYCFASIIFNDFDDTGVNYTIAVSADAFYHGTFNPDAHHSLLSDYLVPLQWAINSRIGDLDSSLKPRERLWDNLLVSDNYRDEASTANLASSSAFWLRLVQQFVAPLFVFIFIGGTHRISKTVASERELADLMAVQGIPMATRILSNILSSVALYLPGWVISSILFSQILFVNVSGGVFFILTVLCGISLVIASHLVATFFRKPSVAGMTCSILIVALALTTIAANLQYNPSVIQINALALCFPPATWATLISDTCRAELVQILGTVRPGSTENPVISNSMYAVFFIVQIVFYLAATFLAEFILWSVRRKYDTLDPSEGVALRTTNLSKTYSHLLGGSAGKPAVNNVSLDVKEGSITFLLGPNGGGKTTLLKSVTGMVSVDAGSRIALNPNHDTFGICPQNNIFWDTLTVKEHVKIWRKLRNAAAITPVNDDDDVIAECDLEEKLHATAKTLSGGQLRKLQLATAFVGGSKMCCIDEASSGLDPLSRRNIWDIIQNGRAKRTILITTHSLDEADVLADHIVIMHQGSVACHGSSTGLKGQYGDGYLIAGEDQENRNDVSTWKFNTSAEAAQKVLELETAGIICDVTYPTLEQVFLKVTNNMRGIGDDGAMLREGDDSAENNKPEEGAEYSANDAGNLNLEVAKSIGILRQTWVLFRKRWILLRSTWFSYLVNLAVPIVIAAALQKFILQWETLQTCEMHREALFSKPPVKAAPTFSASLIGFGGSDTQLAVVGPQDSFSSDVQNQLLEDSISAYIDQNSSPRYSSLPSEISEMITRVQDEDAVANTIKDAEGEVAFGLWAPTPEENTIFYSGRARMSEVGMAAFDYLTNRLANMTTSAAQARQVTTGIEIFNYVPIEHNILNLPLQMLLVLAFIVSASTAVQYPTFEKRAYVRALQYSNGVSPFALWLGYLIFDFQFILIESLVVWGLWFSGTNGERIWYAPSYIVGVFILFGIATYLGTYLVSMYFRRGVFGVAAGIHILLTAIYFAAYVMNQYLGPAPSRQDVYTSLQNGLGLVCPGANLARGLWLAMNTFDVLCGKYGTADVSYAMAYSRYGGVYCNLILQILFLVGCLGAYEYGSAEWLRRRLRSRGRKGDPGPVKRGSDCEQGSSTGYDADEIPLQRLTAPETESPRGDTTATLYNFGGNAGRGMKTLELFGVTRSFGNSLAVDDVSFDISRDQMMALLGANGAGKTTIFNMIRGELRPDSGSIYVAGVSVVDQPSQARLHIGVCPQDDAVDNLTVRQTLNFYASVKGLQDIDGNVNQVLQALNITDFSNHAVKALSGGTKRKLTVCIALLGNPQLLLLDEPSTGQDAGAKRLLWRALQRVGKGRAILLTTHSMEEAETLADKATIISTRMLASGTLSRLQDLHGGLYKVRGVRLHTDQFETEDRVRETFSQLDMQVINYWDSNGLVQFQLVHDRAILGRIMRAMEGLAGNTDSNGGATGRRIQMGEGQIFSDYTLTGPMLEEVFVNVMRKERRDV